MKKFSIAIAAVALVLVAGTAFAQKVTTDSDPAAPFASYKTYAWTKGTESTNPLGEKRIHDGVDAKLAAASPSTSTTPRRSSSCGAASPPTR